MKKTYYPTIKETLYHEKMSNGLNVYLMPKDGFTKTYGLFSTRFGSIDRSFIPLGETDLITVPDGVAHFLEHKMFDMEEGDASEKFAALGASSNAFTSHSRTAYLFNTATNVDECTELLLDFVQELNVTPESIEKEKGIINQEIGMYNDDPDWRGYFGAISNLYHNHPIRIDIAGTVETVAEIDYDILQKCYHTFYHPSNMFIVVSGNFNVEKIMETIRENQRNKEFKELDKIKIKEFEEKDKVYKEKEIIKSSTNIPKAAYTIKIPLKNIKLTRRKLHLYLYILFTTLFDETSDFDQKLKEENIITSTTYVSLLNCNTHILISLINETPKYEEFLSKLKEKLETLEVKEADFNRKKKVLISNEMLAFESVETVNDIIIDNIIYDNKLEDNPIEIIKSLTYKELKELIKELDIKNTNTVIVKK